MTGSETQFYYGRFDYFVNKSIFSMATPAPRFSAKPPDRGSFPIDHEGLLFIAKFKCAFIYIKVTFAHNVKM